MVLPVRWIDRLLVGWLLLGLLLGVVVVAGVGDVVVVVVVDYGVTGRCCYYLSVLTVR